MPSKQLSHLGGATGIRHLRPNQLPLELNRRVSAPIRELLQRHGLRTSLNRIKVLNALAVAAREGRALGIREVHAFLEASSVELSLMSVREVLKRLADEGGIIFQDDKTYRLTGKDWAILKQHFQS